MITIQILSPLPFSVGGPVGPFLIGPTHSETLRMAVDICILRQWLDKYKLPHPLALVRAHLSFHP
jgi:hypothetical protein